MPPSTETKTQKEGPFHGIKVQDFLIGATRPGSTAQTEVEQLAIEPLQYALDQLDEV
jgi:hypothetical protein